MIVGSSSNSTSSSSHQQRDVSLVEQKRMQWAKEREEMDRMGTTEMFAHSQSTKYEKTSIKTYFSNVDLSSTSSMHFDEPRLHPSSSFVQQQPLRTDNRGGNSNYFFAAAPSQSNVRSMRSPSLPPIEKDKFYNFPNSQTLVINAPPADTGYNSETSPLNDGPTTAEVWTNVDDDGRGSNKTVTLHPRRPQFFDNGNRVDLLAESMQSPGYSQFPPNSQNLSTIHHHLGRDMKPVSTPNSLSSGQTFSTSQSGPDFTPNQQRRKWSNNFDPMTRSLDSRSSQNVPYWLEKGLHEIRDSEDESVRDFSRSYIRGQNIPVDPNILAERVGRRRKAMELQNAIKEQLLEQERLKKWEKEKRLQEERILEERMMQQLEAEKQRLEYEKRVQEEKAENERRKHEIMRLAVEKAELEAKLEKEKRRKHLKEANEDDQVQYSRQIHQSRVLHSPDDVETINQNGQRTENNLQREDLVASPTTVKIEKASFVVEPPTVTAIITPRAAAPPPQQEIVATTKATDIDGIALVLQSITPMVPMANIGHDLLGLNNSVNNLQFALLLAQQQQQLNIQARQINTISSASSILSTTSSEATTTSPNTVREEINKKRADASTNQAKSKSNETQGEDSVEGKECIYCSRIHGLNREVKKESPKEEERTIPQKEIKEQFEEEIPEKMQASDKEISSSPEPVLTLEVPKLPSDGTFIKEDSDPTEGIKLDVEISTQTDHEFEFPNAVVTWENPRILTPRKYRVSSATKALVQTNEVAIQTDLLLLQNCHICSHKQNLVLKEISQVTTSVTQTSSRRNNELSPLRSPYLNNNNKDGDHNPHTTTTVTTTTTIRAKANDRKGNNNKKEPRPKWGVNRPSVQYVKASDRDPFCLRRRKKNSHRKKMYSMEEDDGENGIPAKIDSGVSSTLSTHSLEDDLEEESVKVNARNMCTEILPITTDGNGQIFVNFRNARYVVKDELAMKQKQQNNSGREKIMEKRSEDLPIIPSLYRTERKLIKSVSDSEYFKGGLNFSEATKNEKDEINLSKRNDM